MHGGTVRSVRGDIYPMQHTDPLFINLVRMFDGADLRDQSPALSIACCAGPDPTTRSRNSSAMAEFYPKV